MQIDNITEIGIDMKKRLYIKPAREKFALIYREAAGIGWDNIDSILHGSEPKNWTYSQWYSHLIEIIKIECNCYLTLTDTTKWVNISDDIKKQILSIITVTSSIRIRE